MYVRVWVRGFVGIGKDAARPSGTHTLTHF